MLAEPPVDREALLAAISTSYGVAGELTFIPLGWGSVCYRLDSYFVKLWINPSDAAMAVPPPYDGWSRGWCCATPI
jgi:hypothetical protein